MPDTDNKYSISFIIPVLNGARFIGDCLSHIEAEMVSSDEIIVVDNGSTDDTLEIANKHSRVKILQYPKVTIAALRNRGADIAKGDILAFIDSDCLVCKGWRNAVEKTLCDDSIHATGAKVGVPANGTWVEKAWFSQKSTGRKKVNYINSGNFIIRRATFTLIHGFNENLITDEDSEIGMRIIKNGYFIINEPDIEVIHLGNVKTLISYYRREKWHSTSMLSTAFMNKIDKPLIMTFVFLICFLMAVILGGLSIYGHFSPLYALLFLLFVPLATAAFRTVSYKNYGYYLQLTVLYFVYFLARSISLFESLIRRLFPK